MAGPVIDVGTFIGRDIIVQYGLSIAPVTYKYRVLRFLQFYLGSDVHPVPFGGRTQEIEILNQWVSNPNSPANLLIAAEAGRGKTALIVRWFDQLKIDIPIAFIPISIRYETSRPSIFYQALAARLAEILEEELPSATIDSTDFYKEKVIEYLHQFEDRKKCCLIIIDGLDEATGWGVETSGLLSNEIIGIRFVVSARFLADDKDESGWLRRLGWSKASNRAEYIYVLHLDKEGIAEVLGNTDVSFAKLTKSTEMLNDLQRITDGDPLLLTYYVEDLLKDVQERGTLQPEQLKSRAAGFGAYFEDWLAKQGGIYQNDHVIFNEQTIKAILAVLSCAIGPLKLRDLAYLVRVIHGCESIIARDTMEPLNRFVIGDGRDAGYSLGHPKLGEYLRQDYFGGSDVISRTRAGFLAWGRETIYGLDSGTLDSKNTPSYLLQFYSQHMQLENASLLSFLELTGNGWKRAWEVGEEGEAYSGLSNDIEVAFRALRNVVEMDEGLSFSQGLAGCIRCGLIGSSLHNISLCIPKELLVMALQHNLLTVGRVLNFLRLHSGKEFIEMACTVIPFLPKIQRKTVIEEALRATFVISDEYTRFSALLDIASHESKEARQAIFKEAVDVAKTIDHQYSRSCALTAIVPLLSGKLIGEVLGIARAIESKKARSNALAVIVFQLPEAQWQLVLEEIMDAIKASDYEHYDYETSLVLSTISPHLTGELIEDALNIARSYYKEGELCEALAAIAAQLPEGQRQTVVEEAVEVIQAINYWFSLERALTAITPLLTGELISEVLEIATAIEDENNRGSALVVIAVQLDLEERRQTIIEVALNTVITLGDCLDRVRALIALAPLLPTVRRQVILEMAMDSIMGASYDWLICALIEISPHLKGNLIDDALLIAREIPSTITRMDVLYTIASHAPEERRQVICEEILDIIKAAQTADRFHIDDSNIVTLSKIVQYFTEEQQQAAVIKEIFECAKLVRNNSARTLVLTNILPNLPEEWHEVVIEAALASAKNNNDESEQSRILILMAPHLSVEQRKIAIEEILVIARRIEYADSRAPALLEIAPQLSEGQLLAVLEEALVLVKFMFYESIQSCVLTGIASNLYLEHQVVMEEVLAEARAIDSNQCRAETLATIALQLPEERQQAVTKEALAAAIAIDYEEYRVDTIITIALQLPHELHQGVMEEILAAVKALDDEEYRVKALIAIAPLLLEEQQQAVLKGALASTRDIDAEEKRADALTTIALLLSKEQRQAVLEEALTVARAIDSNQCRAETLATIALQLPEERQQAVTKEALAAAIAIDYEEYRVDTIITIALQLPHELHQGVMEKALVDARSIYSDQLCVKALIAIAPHLPYEQQQAIMEEALAVARVIVDAEDRAETLTTIALQMLKTQRQSVIEEALVAARAIVDAKDRSRRLVKMLLELPEECQIEIVMSIIGTFKQLNRYYVFMTLEDIQPVLIQLGGQQLIDDVVNAIIDVSKSWP